MLRKLVYFIGGMVAAGALGLGLVWSQAPSASAAEAVGTAVVEVAALGPGGGRGGDRRGGEGQMLTVALFRETMEATGLDRAALQQELEAGKSLAQVAAASGSSGDAVVQAVLDKLKERLDTAVQRGRISQERADTLLQEATTKANAIVNDTALGAQIAERADQARQRSVMPALIKAASDATGLPVGEITGRLRDGESLTTIVTGAGGDINAVIDAATKAFRDAAVEAVK